MKNLVAESADVYGLTKNKTDFPRVHINSSKTGSDFIRQFYSDDIGIYESFFILLLDRGNTTIGYAKISQGGIAGTVVDPKIVAKYMVGSLAPGVILAHNHPSGRLKPSEADRTVTKTIKAIGALLDCTVLDHVILVESVNGNTDYYYSFADECEI